MDGDSAADEPRSGWMSLGLGLQTCTELSRRDRNLLLQQVNPKPDSRSVSRFEAA